MQMLVEKSEVGKSLLFMVMDQLCFWIQKVQNLDQTQLSKLWCSMYSHMILHTTVLSFQQEAVDLHSCTLLSFSCACNIREGLFIWLIVFRSSRLATRVWFSLLLCDTSVRVVPCFAWQFVIKDPKNYHCTALTVSALW